MKKRTTILIMGICLILIALAELLSTSGLLPVWAGFILIVLTFPWFLLALMLWWKAPGGEKDLPFIGY